MIRRRIRMRSKVGGEGSGVWKGAMEEKRK